MGLDWSSQFVKLKQRFAKGIVEITIPSKGGLQTMICLMLRKLPAWLYSIQSGKVKPEIRNTVIKYQEECDDVLWEHWSGKLNARRKAFDELNGIDMDDKVSKGKATFHSLGMHQRKKEKKINEQKRLSWMSKHIGFLDF